MELIKFSRVWSYFSNPNLARLIVLFYWIFSGTLLVSGYGSFLNYAFPALAGVCAVLLYRQAPADYMSFVLWLWFLSPLVRRLVDYQSGFSDPSPVLVAPYMAVVVCLPDFLRRIRRDRDSLPFVLASLGVVYGGIVGFLNEANVQSLIIGVLDYIAPIAFGYFLFGRWRQHELFSEKFKTTLLYGVLLSGTYGIFQYIIAPSWDNFWLVNIDLDSMGRPEPFGLRVWSTMHSPGVFSQVMASNLVFISVVINGVSAIPANIVGYLSLAVSIVRSAWLGLFAGFFILFPSLNYRFKTKVVFTVFVASICLMFLLQNEVFYELVSDRLSGVQNVGEDVSAVARLSIYTDFFESSLFNVVGSGISLKTGLDSALLALLADLGWIGAVPYLSGLVMMIVSISSQDFSSDVFERAAFAAAMTCFCQIPFGSVHVELPGTIMWAFFCMALSSKKYRISQIGELNGLR